VVWRRAFGAYCFIALTATIAAAALNADPNADATPARKLHVTQLTGQPDRNIDMLVQRPNHEAAVVLWSELHTRSHTQTHTCMHAQNSRLAGIYSISCKNPSMKLHSNCDKRYTPTPMPTPTHLCMHAHRGQTGLGATSTEADPETQNSPCQMSSQASMQ